MASPGEWKWWPFLCYMFLLLEFLKSNIYFIINLYVLFFWMNYVVEVIGIIKIEPFKIVFPR